jgi:hypothetical protein
MGLDLYAGSLARHAARDFESPQARFSRLNGLQFRTVYPEGMVFPTLDEARLDAAVFKRRLEKALNDAEIEFEDWDDAVPACFCEQLHYECDLALRAACAYRMRPQLERPRSMSTVEAGDEVLEGLTTEEYFQCGMAGIECQIIVPGTFFGYVPIEDLRASEVVVTSTAQLAVILDELNIAFWNGRAQIAEWSERGPAPAGSRMIMRRGLLPWSKKWVEETVTAPEDALMWNAEYAFACWSAALAFSVQHAVPICRDA